MSGGDDPEKPEDSQQTRTLASISARQWNYAQEHLRPLQDIYMQQVEGINSEANKEFVSGRANVGMQSALTESTGAIQDRAAEVDLDIDSGRVAGLNTDAAIAAAQGGADTAARGGFELDQQKVGGLQNIVAMGSGEKQMALTGLQRTSATSEADARAESVNKFNRNSANLQTLGTVAGAGTAYGLEEYAPESWRNR